jgi:hypothetical protein
VLGSRYLPLSVQLDGKRCRSLAAPSMEGAKCNVCETRIGMTTSVSPDHSGCRPTAGTAWCASSSSDATQPRSTQGARPSRVSVSGRSACMEGRQRLHAGPTHDALASPMKWPAPFSDPASRGGREIAQVGRTTLVAADHLTDVSRISNRGANPSPAP